MKVRDFDKALGVMDAKLSNSDSAEAKLVTGSYFLATAKDAAAVRELRRAQQLNPQLLTDNSLLPEALALSGEHDAAEQSLEETVRRDLDDFEAHAFLGWLYLESASNRRRRQGIDARTRNST